MATTAAFPAVRPARPTAAPVPAAARPRRALPSSGTALLLLFAVATIVAVVPIAAVVASPSWLMLGIALGTNLALTGVILAVLVQYLDGR